MMTETINSGDARMSVTQSLPNQAALIHSASRYCSWNNKPRMDCTSISAASAIESRYGNLNSFDMVLCSYHILLTNLVNHACSSQLTVCVCEASPQGALSGALPTSNDIMPTKTF